MLDEVYLVSTEGGGFVAFSSEGSANSYAEMYEKCYDETALLTCWYSVGINFLSGLIRSGRQPQLVTDDVIRIKSSYSIASNEQVFYSRISMEDAEQFAKEEREEYLPLSSKRP